MKEKTDSKMGNITQKWVNVILPFCEDYSAKINASEISRRTKLPQQTVSRILNKLVKNNLIEYTREGKNKMFYLNLKKNNSKIILNIVENHKALKFQLKNKKIALIINKLLESCDGLIIFGSYASGKEYEKSDLDIVILGKYDKKKIKEIKKGQGIEIQEHYSGYDEFEKILKEKNDLAIEILKNHVLFGNVSQIVNIFFRGVNG